MHHKVMSLVQDQFFFKAISTRNITRNFVENRDGTYDLYEVPKVDVENVEDGKINKQMPIRPFELKTYLKVGNFRELNIFV
jgi:hypothetical protein